MKILKEIQESPFVYPKKKYYLGKIKHYCPYFLPMNFNSNIINTRKLKLASKEEYEELNKKRPWNKEQNRFTNLPLNRRNKDWIIKLFSTYYFITISYPFCIHWLELGWKDKWNSPRHEWNPAFYIFFFKWQLCIHWCAPEEDFTERYWEMLLWWLYYSDKDIKKAEESWGWVDTENRKSTWNNKYLKNS